VRGPSLNELMTWLKCLFLAVEESIRPHENRWLLQTLNDANDDVTDSDEQALRDKMHQWHRQLVEGQW